MQKKKEKDREREREKTDEVLKKKCKKTLTGLLEYRRQF
jgi:hypothetical protein